jgi:predicted dehydrogenase
MSESNETIGKKVSGKTDRRQFLKASAAISALITIVPRHVLGGAGYTAPSEKLNVAGIGAGGQGGGNIRNVDALGHRVVALCDVDDERAKGSYQRYPDARRYKDYRELFDREKDLDAVIVSTPDHTHAVIGMEAIRRKIHLYLEKPLAHSIYETRQLTQAAHKAGIVTQMGNAGHADGTMRSLKEWLADGAVGEIQKIELWAPSPLWPQGINRPKETPPVPSTLAWDLWLGPAPERPYHPAYHPSAWRGWWDFGSGGLGDMGCHVFDPIFYALDISHVETVVASYSNFIQKIWDSQNVLSDETYPQASIVRYMLKSDLSQKTYKVSWYDGGLMPEQPEELEEGLRMGSAWGGGLITGDKAKIMFNSHGAEGLRIIPMSKMRAYKKPPETLPRSIGHFEEFFKACQNGDVSGTGSNFAYGGPLTEAVLLGNVAIRAGKKIQWDPKKMEVTNVPEANAFLRRDYRQGWTL